MVESGADVLSLEIDDGVDHYVVPGRHSWERMRVGLGMILEMLVGRFLWGVSMDFQTIQR